MTDYTVVDIETTGELPWTGDLVAVGIGDVVYRPEEGQRHISDLLSNPKSLVVAHTNYDLRWLVLNGAPFVDGVRYHDTKVMAFMLDQTQGVLALDDLAWKYLGFKPPKPIKAIAGRILYDLSKGMGVCEGLECPDCKGSKLRPDHERFKSDLMKRCPTCKGAGMITLIPIEDVPWPEMEAYNLSDIQTEGKLYEHLRDLMQSNGLWELFLAEEAPLSRLLIEMEVAGMPVDRKGIRQLLTQASHDRDRLGKDLVGDTLCPTFNLKSGDQVAAFLYDELPTFKVQIEVPALNSIPRDEREAAVVKMIPRGIKIDKIGNKFVYGKQVIEGCGLKPPPIKKKKGKVPKRPPIDAENLALLYGDHYWVKKYLKWKSLNTLCTNYLDVWVEVEHEHRLHGRFDQSRAETGRIASRDPNMQAIPVVDTPVRKMFTHTAEAQYAMLEAHGYTYGGLMIGDYSGLDARVAAHFSEDPLMMEIFLNEEDLYGRLASEAWGGAPNKTNKNRGLMKILILSAQYGAQAGSIGDKIRISGLGDKFARKAPQLLRNLEETLPRLFEWREEVLQEAKTLGYITTISGRRRYLPDLQSTQWYYKARAERQCVASMVQGSSADIVRKCMIAAREKVTPMAARMILQVHDEILWERGPEWDDNETFDVLVDTCENAHGYDLRVPMKFEAGIGDSWEEKDAVGARSYRVLAGRSK